ncbi:MAG: rod shape-determining protein [Anaerovibrio sp.]|nr:rod shape-determining protein [Anaerovibrio sp.]
MADLYPLLPKLKIDSAVTPSKASSWTDETSDFLVQLIKSLAVPDDTPEYESIDSIPDVWARPLLFAMALFDKQTETEQQFGSTLFKRVQGEWRCLLAMLALNQVKNLNLRAEQVILRNEATSSLESILAKMAPGKDGLISDDTDWKNLYIIFFQDIPIGITSPSSLLAASADYMSDFDGTLPSPWSTDGYYMEDPIPYLTNDDLTSLHGWLKSLSENLKQRVANQDDNNEFLMVRQRLEEYCDDIQKRLGRRVEMAKNVAKPGTLKLNIGIFHLLDTVIPAKEAAAEDSQVRLLPSAGRNPQGNILLVSPMSLQEMADGWGIPKTQLVIWAGITANDVSETWLTEDKGKLGDVLLKNAQYRRPEEFFTEKLTLVEPANSIPGAMNIRGSEMIANDENCSVFIPLKQEILEYLTAAEIMERMWIERNNDAICVHFNFPVSGVGGQKDYEFVKQYKESDIIYVMKSMPDIEIWPDFKRDDWHKYYFYYGNADSDSSTKEAGKDFFYATPWSYGIENGNDVPDCGLANQYTACISAFPEVLMCYVNSSAKGSTRSMVEDGGMIVLQPPQTIDVNNMSKWDVSVDFGTSSTMVYYKDKQSEPAKLPFTPHLFQVTDSGVLRNNLYYNFMPENIMNPDGSFLTIFHILNTKVQNADLRTLQDGHIFPLEMDESKVNRFVANEDTIEANLKWQGDVAGTDSSRRKAKSYLEQICLQSAAEAAGKGIAEMKWHFSYPSAFSVEGQDSFEATCRRAGSDACKGTSFAIGSNAFDTQLESVATALYFNKLGNSDTNFGDGAICLDIGAGTTDISIISGRPGRIVFNTSIRFAGRYLFKPIYDYDYETISGRQLELGTLNRDQRNTVIDADMRANSEAYLNNLINITGADTVKEILQDCQFAMSGIMHYVGMLLKKLHDEGIYQENHVPDIYVGGNGSRIFQWLVGGSGFSTDSVRMNVLKKVLQASAGFGDDYSFTISLSDKPKIEVASGMITERPRHNLRAEEETNLKLFGDTEDEYLLSSVLTGEGFEVAGQAKEKDAFISARDIAAGVDIVDLPEFDAFVEQFNKQKRSIWFNGVKYTEQEQNDLKKAVLSYYVAEKGKDVKEIYVEPVYITALKKMMEMMRK